MHRMKHLFVAVLLVMGLSGPATEQLAEGVRAPNFATRVALAGQEQGFSLRSALRQGPVVLYFYPKAFTQGCTLEANAFAEAMPEFRRAGATVVGLSNEDIETLKRFSREECRDAFPVGVANQRVIEAYKVGREGSANTSRTSYVIARDGRVTMVYSNGDWREHVSRTLAAVRALSD